MAGRYQTYNNSGNINSQGGFGRFGDIFSHYFGQADPNTQAAIDNEIAYDLSPEGQQATIDQLAPFVGSVGNVGRIVKPSMSFLDWAASHGMPWLKDANNVRKFASNMAGGNNFNRIIGTPKYLRSAERMLNGGKGGNVIDPVITAGKVLGGLSGTALLTAMAEKNRLPSFENGINPGTEVKAGGGIVNPIYKNGIEVPSDAKSEEDQFNELTHESDAVKNALDPNFTKLKKVYENSLKNEIKDTKERILRQELEDYAKRGIRPEKVYSELSKNFSPEFLKKHGITKTDNSINNEYMMPQGYDKRRRIADIFTNKDAEELEKIGLKMNVDPRSLPNYYKNEPIVDRRNNIDINPNVYGNDYIGKPKFKPKMTVPIDDSIKFNNAGSIKVGTKNKNNKKSYSNKQNKPKISDQYRTKIIGKTINGAPKIDMNPVDESVLRARGLVPHVGEVDERGNPIDVYWDYPNKYQQDYASSAPSFESFSPYTDSYENYSIDEG